MVATTSTSFMVSYRYYNSDIPASDPIPIVDGLKTFQDAARYALAIQLSRSYYCYGGWAPCSSTLEKWDFEAGRATLRYEHRIHYSAAAFEITIRPSPKFNVSICWFIDGLPATNPVFVSKGLEHFDDAVEDARQVFPNNGDNNEWSLKGIEYWDQQNGWGTIRYYHLEDDKFFQVLVYKLLVAL